MDPKYKTLIPLIIIFFIIGAAVGYVAHKPGTIEKIEYVENRTVVTVTVTVTPPGQTVTPTLAPTAIVTPEISDFTIKNYDPFTDTPKYTMKIRNWAIDPQAVSIHVGDTVLIAISEVNVPAPITMILNNTEKKYLGNSGAAVVTFNKKGIFNLKAVLSSSDPNIVPRTYGEGTISVY